MDRFVLSDGVEGDVVLGVHSDTAAVSLSLVERISDTLVVVMEKTAVLHKLDSAIFDHTSTLRMGVHDGNLKLLGGIAHGDCRLDGIVVVIDFHLSLKIEVRAVVTDTFLHLKAI